MLVYSLIADVAHMRLCSPGLMSAAAHLLYVCRGFAMELSTSFVIAVGSAFGEQVLHCADDLVLPALL
jgi:hypothetical protein